MSKEKKLYARCICDALADQDKEKLFQLMRRILFDQLNLQEICSLETGDGKSPIRYAIIKANGDSGMLKELKAKSVRLDVRMEPNKMTVLHLAVNVQDKKILKYLLTEAGVKINSTDSEGETPLHYAFRNRSMDICNTLIKRGAKLEAQERDGKTALHIVLGVMISDPTEKIELLCKKGANPNIKDHEGNTVLHTLLKRRSEDLMDILSILMKYGAQTDLLNNDGFTAWNLYVSNTDHEEEERLKVKNMLSGERLARSQSVSKRRVSVDGAVGGQARRKSSFDMFKRSLSNLIASSRKSSTVSMPDIKENSETDPPLDTEEERLRLARAFATSLSDLNNDWNVSQVDSDDLECLSVNSGSPTEDAYMTDVDDFGDNDSVMSSLPGSRMSSANNSPNISRVDGLHGNKFEFDSDDSDDSISHAAANTTDMLTSKHQVNDKHTADNDGDHETEYSNVKRKEAVEAVETAAVGEPVEQTNARLEDNGDKKMKSYNSSDYNGNDNVDYEGDYEDDDDDRDDDEDDNEKNNAKSVDGENDSNASSDAKDVHKTTLQNLKEKISTATLVPSAKRSRAGTLTGILLATKNDSEEDEEDESNPFVVISSKNESECISYLKTYSESGSLIDLQRRRTSESLLHVAAVKGFINLIEYLINSGIEVSATDRTGLTSLHIAAKQGKLAIVKLLISSGASVERMTLNGESALDFAITSNHIAVVEYLLRKDTLSAYVIESALLSFVKMQRAYEIMNILIKHIDERISDGDVEIHLIVPLAAERKHWKVLNFLIEQRKRKHCKVTLDKRDEAGYCALHYCAMSNSILALKKLHKAGASIKRKSTVSDWTTESKSQTVLSIARAKQYKELMVYAEAAYTN